jgi:L-ascorbate metabolism protein UlaG (beta-lactamase superfamily)
MVENITWLGHTSFRIIASGKTVYIDPWKIGGGPTADIVLISHPHVDHCSKDDYESIAGPETLLIATPDSAEELGVDAKFIAPGESVKSDGVNIIAVPAYNTEKKFHEPVNKWIMFHPREKNWLGFIIEADGRRIYYAGDTVTIPEMGELGKIDIAILPVGGKYTMDAAEAAEVAALIKPGLVIPCHFGANVGTQEDAEEFARLAPCPVEIPQRDG